MPGVGVLWALLVVVALVVDGATGAGPVGLGLTVAVAAGLRSGLLAAALTAVAVALGAAALSGGSILGTLAICLPSGLAAGVVARRMAGSNVVLAMATVAALTLITVTLAEAYYAGWARAMAGSFGLMRAGQNALWMMITYGVIFVVYSAQREVRQGGEETPVYGEEETER